VLGVGFLSEYLKRSYAKTIQDIRDHHQCEDQKEVEVSLSKKERRS